METVVLLCQTVSLCFPMLWLASGVRDNLLYPTVNETYTAMVMDMQLMREEYPEAYEKVAHRRVKNRGVQRGAFWLVVVWELLSTCVLCAGFTLMAAAVVGLGAVETARAVSMIGALMFTTTWAMFLVVGNHFCYWFGHEGAQNTHFQMTIWGVSTMVFLAVW